MSYSAKVSVVIPVYNGEAFVAAAINSALTQQYENIEIIVVNDLSTDNTLTVLEAFSDQIRVINNNENKGASFSRNQGIKAATGDYIAFLDADDIWFPNKLNRQLGALASHPECSFSYGLVKVQAITEEHDEVLNSQDKDFCPIKIRNLRDVFKSPYFSTSTIIIAKKLCNDIGFFREDLNTAEDIDFCLKAAVISDMVEVSTPLSLTRRVENSLGSAMSSYQDNLNVIDDFLKQHPTFAHENESIIKQIKKKILDDWLCDLLYERKLTQAKEVAMKSLGIKVTFNTSKLLLKSIIMNIIGKKKAL